LLIYFDLYHVTLLQSLLSIENSLVAYLLWSLPCDTVTKCGVCYPSVLCALFLHVAVTFFSVGCQVLVGFEEIYIF